MKQHHPMISAYMQIYRLGIVCLMMLVLAGCSIKTPNSAEEWASSVQNCWPCTLYRAVFDSINKLMYSLYDMMADKAIAILGIGLLFWLAFKTGKMVVSIAQPNIKEYVHSVMVVLFKAMLVATLLATKQNFFCFLNVVISPILETFALISSLFLNIAVDISGGVNLSGSFVSITESSVASCPIFSEATSFYVQDTIYRVYVALNSGIALGATMVADLNVISIILGLFVMWIFLVLTLVFPWMFSESFFRLGCVIVLSPLLFVAWVFPQTKQMIKSGWNILFGSMMQILIASIYIALAITVIKTFGEDQFPGMLGGSRQTSDPSYMTAMRRLTTTAISFFALIMIINKQQKSIPHISGYFGGDSQKSTLVAVMGALQQLAIAAAQIAVGAALAGCGIPLGKKMMERGAKKAMDAAKDLSSTEGAGDAIEKKDEDENANGGAGGGDSGSGDSGGGDSGGGASG